MPRSDRPACTLFYWADWLTDPAVRALSREERGGYIDVLAFTQQTSTPGVMTEDDVRGWSGYSVAEWAEHRSAMARCFAVDGGVWTQKRAVAEHRRQVQRLSNAQKGGFAKHDRERTSLLQQQSSSCVDPAVSPADPLAPRARAGSRFSVLGESSPAPSAASGGELERKALSNNGQLALADGLAVPATRTPKATAPTVDPDELTAEQWFDEEFWPKYPRKEKRKGARVAMVALFRKTSKPKHDELAEAILEGLARYCVKVEGKDAEFVATGESWVNGRRWEDGK